MRIIFKGSSPFETDYGRGLRAEQWARFCGRHTCAEIIEKCSRSRILEREVSGKNTQDKAPGVKDKTGKGRARANSAVQSSSKVSMLSMNNNIPISNINNNSGMYEVQDSIYSLPN